MGGGRPRRNRDLTAGRKKRRGPRARLLGGIDHVPLKGRRLTWPPRRKEKRKMAKGVRPVAKRKKLGNVATARRRKAISRRSALKKKKKQQRRRGNRGRGR